MNNDIEINILNNHITIAKRYNDIALINDIMVGLWFLIGSIFFLYQNLVHLGTWFFIVGSAQLLIKPIIKLTRNIHIERLK